MNNIQTTRHTSTELDPIRVGEIFAASGMFPDTRDAAQCATKLIVGRGLGLSDYDAMAGLHLIQGKVTLAANLMAAAIKRHPKYDYRAETNDQVCAITFYSYEAPNDGSISDTRHEIGTTSFTLDDAKRAGLTGTNWKKYPKAMLFARCISAGYREHCPDALGNAPVYVEQHGEFEIPKPATPPASQASVLPSSQKATPPPPQSLPAPTRKPTPTPSSPVAASAPAENDDTYSRVSKVTPRDVRNGTLYIIEIDEPFGDENGYQGRRTIEATTFDDSIGEAAAEAMDCGSPIEYQTSINGKYTNLTHIGTFAEPGEQQLTITDEDIPF